MALMKDLLRSTYLTIPSEQDKRRLTRKELDDTVKLYERYGSVQRVATELGLARSSVRDRLRIATARGIGPHFSAQSGCPEGLAVSGVSTLYGPDGAIRGQWIKEQREQEIRDSVQIIKDAFGDYTGSRGTKLKLPSSASRLTVVPVADLHFGMYAWKEETGNDYDTAIAAKALEGAYDRLAARSEPSDLGIVLNLGDFFHSDNDEQKTRRSGNKLDVDTRYARVLREGVQLLIRIVEQAKQKHKHVLVKNIPGNHDPYGSLALTTALAARYASDDKVTVDTNADPIWRFRFGKTLLTAAHGDMVRPQDMPSVSAARFPEDWGASTWRYAYLGHIHKRRSWKNKPDSDEYGGMEVEIFRTVAPKDSWGTQKGFVSRRSLVAITHDKEHGEVMRVTENIE